ncbi:hypothetical protein [Lysobacter antibioticus]|uniref:hypothetical protein n=1 Tax=Lysobacter antibioticus TaxID=84531 RepID=UPI000716425E|nr:hypothetical protein [Lysobacter antibioticus]
MWIFKAKLTPPEVPPRLRELLKDYPGHVERLREVLEKFAEPKPRLQPFDEAIWALESVLDGFVDEANVELHEAEASNCAEAIRRAQQKRQLMLSAQSRGVGLAGESLQGLWDFFETNRRASE